MMALNNYEKKMLVSIGSSHAKSLIEKLGEVAVDQVISEAAVRDIPIIGTALSLIKAGNDIKAYLFAKKILGFLTSVDSVSQEDREKFVSDLESSDPDTLKKIGQDILFAIEDVDSVEKSEMLGRLYVNLILGNVDSYLFTDLCHALKLVNLSCLPTLALWADERNSAHGGFTTTLSELARYGLFEQFVTNRMHPHNKDQIYVSHNVSWLGKMFYKYVMSPVAKSEI